MSEVSNAAAVATSAVSGQGGTINPKQFAEMMSYPPETLSALFEYMANHIFDARLIDGRSLTDTFTFREWLEELSREMAAL